MKKDVIREYACPGKDTRKWRKLRKGLVARRRAPQSRGGCECGIPRGPPSGGVSLIIRGFSQVRGQGSCSRLGGKEDVSEAVVRGWARWGKCWIRGLRLQGLEQSNGAGTERMVTVR